MTVTPQRPDPVAAADAAAIALARRLLFEATHAALAWTDPETGTPGISRIGLALDPKGLPLALVSALAPHTPALRAHPEAALLVGEPGERGDPLTHPRLMIRVRAVFIPRSADHDALRAHWLNLRPKAQVYVNLPDFAFVRLVPQSALLNGGFGRAFRLEPQDLAPQDLRP